MSALLRIAWVLPLIACAGAAPCPRSEAKATRSPTSHVDEPSDTIEKSVTSAHLVYVFRAARLSNLVYQLDCLSGVSHCSRVAFEELWEKTLGSEPGDKEAIATWRTVHFRYSGRFERNDETPSPLPLPQRRRTAQGGMRVAGYQATDTSDFAQRISLFADAPDADAARAVIVRFSARFDRFWASRRDDLARAVDGYTKLAARDDVRAIADSVEHFYGPELPNGAREIFEIIARPKHDSPDMGEQVDTFALVEAQPDERPEHRFDVVMHELFHSWFAEAPFERKLALAKRFVASNDPSAVPAWALLDEVLATSFGNGLVDRAVDRADFDKRWNKKLGMYNDPAIDAVTKAMMPKLEARVTAGKTLFDDEFTTELLGAVATAFPNGFPAQAFLTPLVCAYDTSVQKAYEHLTDVSRSHQIVSSDGLDDPDTRALFPPRAMWGAALLVPSNKLDVLASWSAIIDKPTLAAIRNAAAKKHPFVFAHRRVGGGALFVFVGNDDAQMITLEDRLVSLEAFREGVVIEI